jgi:hypothetical protein
MNGRRLVTAVGLVGACAAAACTSGTTPDCSEDAQCSPVLEVFDGGDAGPPADASAGKTGTLGSAIDGSADGSGHGASSAGDADAR